VADVGALRDSVLAFVSTGGGAWAGAYAAQRIAEKAKLRERHGEEVRVCNAAIELCGSIGNTYLSLKRQHVQELITVYEDQRRRVHEAFERMQRTGDREAVDVGRLDLAKLDIVRVRASRLETLLTEKLSVGGRAVGLLGFLMQSIESLNNGIELRNELIDQLRELNREEQVPLVFGLRVDGRTDETYTDLVRGIARETDDCIVFTRQICMDLEDYGERARAAYLRKYRGIIPRVSHVNFDARMHALGLTPDLESYQELINTHVTMPRATRGRRWAKARVGMRRFFRWSVWRWRELFGMTRSNQGAS
jgi:hypothetical protein